MTGKYSDKALKILEQLIRIPSISREEGGTADLLETVLKGEGVSVNRVKNNVWAGIISSANKPTILLNSHHDTVKPVNTWKTDPFEPIWQDNKLIGLGSNDAGAALVSLLMTFLHFGKEELPWNLIFLASAEEEVSGSEGIELALKDLPGIDLAIVGEPTGMDMAIAEKGLCVVDGVAHGSSGHAAREEGINALYIALDDIQLLKEFSFQRESELLGPVKLSITQIEAGSQHNVVPDVCRFVIDIRTNENYSNQEVVDTLQSFIQSTLTARSYRLNSSGLPESHAAILRARELGIRTYGSPTLSDQALMDFPSLKMGPGDSARSHTAGEYIQREELERGIRGYVDFLTGFKL